MTAESDFTAGSVWSLTAEHGGHLVVVADLRFLPEIGVLLVVDRRPGPFDVVLDDAAIEWNPGKQRPANAVACYNPAILRPEWLADRLGQLGELECGVAGWLTAPPPLRFELPEHVSKLLGPPFNGAEDPLVAVMDDEADMLDRLTDLADAEPAPSVVPSLLGWLRRIIVPVATRPVALRGRLATQGPRSQVQVTSDASELFGEGVTIALNISNGTLSVRLTHISKLADGTVIGLLAVRSDGSVVEGKGQTKNGRASLELSWPENELAPSELTIGVIAGPPAGGEE